MATRVSLLKKSKSWVWLVLAGGVVGACIEIPERSPSVAAGGTSSINGGKGGSGNAPSSGGDGNTGNDASGGTETGTAGTTSGGAGATSGSGGTTIGNGGSESAGAGGGGAGGEETGGGGAGGAPTVSYCAGRFIALNDIAGDTLIDDFEDGDSNIYARDGRQGSWVLGELGTGTSTPAPGPLTPTVDGGYSDGKGIYVIGSGDPSWL
ncbi:MAG TPA: hypothetical protein VM686_24160, partial [Polyangiaceae bacterium]|nr:hypothetical protein [Polyangiaceae bacterium]